jgi:hypothetical protein
MTEDSEGSGKNRLWFAITRIAASRDELDRNSLGSRAQPFPGPLKCRSITEAYQLVMKFLEPIRVHDQVDIFGESGITISYQGYRSDNYVIDLMLRQVSDQTLQGIVELSFTHEIALRFSVGFGY